MNIRIIDFVNTTEIDSEFIVEEGSMTGVMLVDPALGGKLLTVEYILILPHLFMTYFLP